MYKYRYIIFRLICLWSVSNQKIQSWPIEIKIQNMFKQSTYCMFDKTIGSHGIFLIVANMKLIWFMSFICWIIFIIFLLLSFKLNCFWQQRNHNVGLSNLVSILATQCQNGSNISFILGKSNVDKLYFSTLLTSQILPFTPISGRLGLFTVFLFFVSFFRPYSSHFASRCKYCFGRYIVK